MKIFLIAFLIMFASPLYANPVFEKYINWLVTNSDFEYNGEELPTLKKIPKDWMEVYAYGSDAVAESDQNGTSLPSVIAVYNHKTNEIVVDKKFQIEDFTKHHIIVHELVHYLQWINGNYDTEEAQDCATSLEPIAYELHVKWMDEVDHPAEKPNELFLFFLEGACDEHHGAGGG